MSTQPAAPGLPQPPGADAAGKAARIELSGVCRGYEMGGSTVTALDGVDLRVEESSFVVVLGASGSGKTTLLNMVGALDTPTSGTVLVGGQDISRASRELRRRVRRTEVSFVFQSFNLFPGLTALENVRFGADTSRRGDAVTAANRTLEEVGLADRATHFPHQLSGGEQQRVAIARALATGNPILLADEPTGELDFRTGVQILQLLRAQADAGRTVVVVTHNREISRVADRVVELSSGRVLSDGPPTGGRAEVADLRW